MGREEEETKNSFQDLQGVAGKAEKREATLFTDRLDQNHYIGTLTTIGYSNQKSK
jgi:hypothetical protein